MRVHVDSYTGYRGAEMVRRLRLGEREIDIAENLDQWHGAGYRYHKVRGNDGNLYILRVEESSAEWELTMFESPDAEAQPTEIRSAKRRRPADT